MTQLFDRLATRGPIVYLTSIIPEYVYTDEEFADVFGECKIRPIGELVDLISEQKATQQNQHAMATVQNFIRANPKITHVFVDTESWDSHKIPVA